MILCHSIGAGAFNEGGANYEKLAIRICRMYWYKHHWQQVKTECITHNYNGFQLVDTVKGQQGLLRDMLGAMCSVY